MPKRKVIILDKEESPWPSFLEEFFSDTKAEIHFSQKAAETAGAISENGSDVFFLKNDLLTPAAAGKLRAHRSTSHSSRIFELQSAPGASPSTAAISWDGFFQEPLIFLDFQKKLVEYLPFPERLRVLIVDDEPEIGETLREYLRSRSSPSYQAEWAPNGREGLKALKACLPDAVILDVKMPEMDGREVYRTICENGWPVPVIVHFDAIFGDEVMELHKIGNPAIVEKGSHASGLPEMEALVRKMVYFA